MNIKPCPFCGNDNLYVGPHAACAEEVACEMFGIGDNIGGCGARIIVQWEDVTPAAVMVLDLDGQEHINAIRRHYQEIAVTRWNQRV